MNNQQVASAPPTPPPLARDAAFERGVPLLGVLPKLLRDPPGYLLQVMRAHPGEIVALRLGPIWLYVVSHPDHVQHVLADHPRQFSKGGMWEAVRQFLGNGLVTSEGDFWLRQRRMMQPLFSGKHLASLAEVMARVAARERDRLLTIEKPIDMSVEMAQLTQRILLETMFGSSVGADEAERLGGRLLEAMRQLNLKLFLYFMPRWFPLPGDRTYRDAIAAIDEAMLRIVGERRAAAATTRGDLLSLLLQARDEHTHESMDDRQLRDELVTMFVAGNDTTANALTWLWYVLDQHPDVDRRLRDEVAAVLGDRAPTVADLTNLNYLKLVVQETMRIFPPVWMFPRFCEEDVLVGGFRIPRRSPILLVPYATHRDATVWERADEFDPERFLPERSAGRPRYAYFPFGGGARQCIGNAFAIMEAQIIVATMVQRFRPRLVPGTEVVPSSVSTLKPKGGLPMTLERL